MCQAGGPHGHCVRLGANYYAHLKAEYRFNEAELAKVMQLLRA